MEEINISPLFKILLVVMTSSMFIYLILIEQDIYKALLLLNVITNYRMILFFLSDFCSETVDKSEVLFKIRKEKERFTTAPPKNLSYPISDERPDPIYRAYDFPLSTKHWWEEDY